MLCVISWKECLSLAAWWRSLFTTSCQFLGLQTWEFLPGVLKMSHPSTWASHSATQSKWGMVEEKLHKSQMWMELILGEREEWEKAQQCDCSPRLWEISVNAYHPGGEEEWWLQKVSRVLQVPAVPREEWGSWMVTSGSWSNAAPLQAFQGCLRWEISIYHLFTYAQWLSECVCKLSQFPARWWCWM